LVYQVIRVIQGITQKKFILMTFHFIKMIPL